MRFQLSRLSMWIIVSVALVVLIFVGVMHFVQTDIQHMDAVELQQSLNGKSGKNGQPKANMTSPSMTSRVISTSTETVSMPPNPALKEMGVDFFDLTLFDEHGVARLPPSEGDVVQALQDPVYLNKQFIAPYFRVDEHQNLQMDIYTKMGLDKLIRLYGMNRLTAQQRQIVTGLVTSALKRQLPVDVSNQVVDLTEKHQKYLNHLGALHINMPTFDVRNPQSVQAHLDARARLQQQNFGALAEPLFGMEQQLIRQQIHQNNQIYDAFQRFLAEQHIKIPEFQNN